VSTPSHQICELQPRSAELVVEPDTEVVDFPLALEVRNPRLSVSTADRAVEKLLYTSCSRHVSNRLALLNLAFVASLPEVLPRESAVGSFEHPVYGRALFHITLHDLGSLLG
jgi:hypothetical protein